MAHSVHICQASAFLLQVPRLLDESDPSLATMAEFADFFLNPQTVTIGLVVFNAIFAVQNLLDIGYLWGGARLPEGMTYASYAHRGAYPLVVTALLAAALMLIVFRPSADQKQGRRNRVLVYIWIAQNILLTVSAAWRLKLYVSVYSLTRLRFAAAVWMLLVAMGLVWICAHFCPQVESMADQRQCPYATGSALRMRVHRRVWLRCQLQRPPLPRVLQSWPRP